jgi:hypothetical protein
MEDERQRGRPGAEIKARGLQETLIEIGRVPLFQQFFYIHRLSITVLFLVSPFNMPTDEKSFDDASPLPTPVSASLPKPRLTATGIIPVWIVLSSSVIIYNNYLYNTLAFPYPVFTVTWHLFFAAIGTRILQRTTHLLDGTKDVRMDKTTFITRILPIGILFSGSLILSNTAYLYLSVSYIQMLKVRMRPLLITCGRRLSLVGIYTSVYTPYLVDVPDTGPI